MTFNTTQFRPVKPIWVMISLIDNDAIARATSGPVGAYWINQQIEWFRKNPHRNWRLVQADEEVFLDIKSVANCPRAYNLYFRDKNPTSPTARSRWPDHGQPGFAVAAVRDPAGGVVTSISFIPVSFVPDEWRPHNLTVEMEEFLCSTLLQMSALTRP